MQITIQVNGKPRSVREGTTVAQLIADLELVPQQVAVERNRVLVRRAEHASTPLATGDELELVTLVGGG